MEFNSLALREKGNQIIKKLQVESNLDHFQKSIFEAIQLYQQSSNHSKDQIEYLKGLKNIVIANIKLFLKILRDIKSRGNYDFLNYQFKELYNSYINLLKKSKHIHHEEELLIHMKKLQKIFSLYFNYSSQSEKIYEDCIVFLQKLNKDFNWSYSNIKFLVLSKIMKKYFDQGILHFEENSFFKACSFFNNVKEVGNEIIHYFRNFKNFDFENHIIYDTMKIESLYFNFSDSENLKTFTNLDEKKGYIDYFSIDDLIDEIEERINEAESYLIKCDIQAIMIKADSLFSDAINEDETIDMELIYYSLDSYRSAHQMVNFLNTKSKPDVELEAIICSKLGCIFLKIFKNYDKAKTFLNQAISLGLSLYPKNISSERWYIKASSALQDIRFKQQEQEEKDIQEKKKEYLEELKDVLKKLDEQADKVKEDKNYLAKFLKYILENHTPIKKTINFKIDEEIEKNKEKKTLLKVIKFYHPDSNGVEEIKMKILIEEIAKRLNDIYTYFK